MASHRQKKQVPPWNIFVALRIWEVTRFCACGQTLKGCQDAEHLVLGSLEFSFKEAWF